MNRTTEQRRVPKAGHVRHREQTQMAGMHSAASQVDASVHNPLDRAVHSIAVPQQRLRCNQ